MRDILGPACTTIGGKDPGNKIRFLGYPQVDHGLGPEYPRRPPPYILALGRAAGNIRRMFESARAGQMIGPFLRAARQLRIPAPRRHPRERALALMARSQTGFTSEERRVGKEGGSRCRICVP